MTDKTESAGSQSGTTSLGAIERATGVLGLFVESRKPQLGVTEIATTLGLSKAVVHRVLTSLRAAELIELDPSTRRYQLGVGALGLGLAYLERVDVRERARPVLEHLAEVTGETATLSIRQGGARVYVDQAFPVTEIRMTVRIGEPFPLHAGSSSKAFLAFLPEHEQEQYLSRELTGLTEETIVDAGTLRADLRAIRGRGYARSFGERQVGAASVAAPIFDHDGKPVAVISVCGPLERFRGRSDQAAKQLLEQTRELSRRLGFH